MPRIYNKNNDPLDFCYKCFPEEDDFLEQEECFTEKGNMKCDKVDGCAMNFTGEDGCHYGYDCDHPAYEDTDYHCISCNKKLIDKDD